MRDSIKVVPKIDMGRATEFRRQLGRGWAGEKPEHGKSIFAKIVCGLKWRWQHPREMGAYIDRGVTTVFYIL